MELRCAYCHAQAEGLVACPQCRTQLHAECWRDVGACPTLGCHACPAPEPPRRRSLRRDLITVVLAGLGIPLGLIGLGVGASELKSAVGAPVIEIRNETGRPLTDVMVEGYQLDAGERYAFTAVLAQGESIFVQGGNTDYELTLANVMLEGIQLAEFPDDPHAEPWWGGRFQSVPWQRSIFAIDPSGRMRTIQMATWRGPLRCTCPDGNASRTGTPGCPIVPIHSTYDVERSSPQAQPVASAPVSDQETR